MKVLVVGGGGREHAIAWKIKQSSRVKKIYAVPGNPGIAEFAECIALPADDVAAITELAVKEKIDLAVVGPEAPLVKGLVDALTAKGIKAFGPSALAAEIEGSKVFMKDLLKKYNLPTAGYAVFTETAEALAYLKEKGAPIVVKADGLAAGKGVIVASTLEEAEEAVRDMLERNAFGDSGKRIIIEDCMQGEEVSLLAFTDGETVVPMVAAQDHKRIFDGDKGLNTGGMGAYSPVPHISEEFISQVVKNVMEPVVRAMKAEGRLYKGVLYAGLMLTADGPSILEFNARFGDPETQVILPRLKSDLVDVMEAVVDGKLADCPVEWHAANAVCVVMASEGYPGSYPKGKVISGLDELSDLSDVVVFHAGTAKKDGRVVTSGGRVLGVTALADDLKAARDKAYAAVEKISFSGVQYRHDIGDKALKR